MKYVIMYYSAIFWVLLRVTRFLLFNYIMHSLVLFKKKPEKLIFEYDIILRLLAEYQPKDYIHPATCIQALVEHFEFEDFIQYVMGKIQTFVILTLVIRCIIYFEDKRSVPNMDSIVYLQYLEGITVFWPKKVSANKFSLVQSILLPIFVGMEEHFATIILFKLRTTGVFTQDHF